MFPVQCYEALRKEKGMPNVILESIGRAMKKVRVSMTMLFWILLFILFILLLDILGCLWA